MIDKFPIYMDYNSTTPVDARVQKVIAAAFADCFGNAASSIHRYGQHADSVVDRSRSQVAELIGSPPANIVWTSGATESNNIAILGTLKASGDGGHMITTAAEHRSVLDPSRASAAGNWRVTILPVNRFGVVCVEDVLKAFQPDTKLVSVIYSNNEVGTNSPISEIGSLCRARHVIFHTDATQSVGKTPIDITVSPIDLMSFSSHKIYGPKGIGALYINRDIVGDRLQPIMYGGGQEHGLRPGTLPVPLIAGFGMACELCIEERNSDEQRIRALRDRLWKRIESEIPDVSLNGHPTDRVYNNLNVSFLGIPSEAFIIKLRRIVSVSAGSACTSSNSEPSHVLRAMQIHPDRIESAIRFGIGRFTTAEEVESVADQVRDAVADLRRHLA